MNKCNLTQEQIDNIVKDLMDMPHDNAVQRIGNMKLSKNDKNLIFNSYCNEYSSSSGARPLKYPAAWWRFIIAPVASMAILIFAPALIWLLINIFGYFFSGFETDFTSLFMYAVASVAGLYAAVAILKQKQKLFLLVLSIIFIFLLLAMSINAFFNNNPLLGVGGALGIIATIIACVALSKDYADEQITGGGIAGIAITSVISILYFLLCLASVILLQVLNI